MWLIQSKLKSANPNCLLQSGNHSLNHIILSSPVFPPPRQTGHFWRRNIWPHRLAASVNIIFYPSIFSLFSSKEVKRSHILGTERVYRGETFMATHSKQPQMEQHFATSKYGKDTTCLVFWMGQYRIFQSPIQTGRKEDQDINLLSTGLMLCRGKSSEKQDKTFKQIYSSQSRKQIQDLGEDVLLKNIVHQPICIFYLVLFQSTFFFF